VYPEYLANLRFHLIQRYLANQIRLFLVYPVVLEYPVHQLCRLYLARRFRLNPVYLEYLEFLGDPEYLGNLEQQPHRSDPEDPEDLGNLEQQHYHLGLVYLGCQRLIYLVYPVYLGNLVMPRLQLDPVYPDYLLR
jgi:hypothetical protein